MMQFMLMVPILLLADSCSAIQQSSVISVAILHRHGQRTAKTDYPLYSNDIFKDLGPLQLTKTGSQQLYNMGLIMRDRYSHLLPAQGFFRLSNMRIKSSVPERCIQSLSSFLAAFFPPPSLDRTLPLNWQPFPFTVDNEGRILHYKPDSCPKYAQEFNSLFMNPPADIQAWMAADRAAFDYLQTKIGGPLQSFKDIIQLADTIRANLLLPIVTPEWAWDAYNTVLRKYISRGFHLLHETPYLTKVRGGPLLTEIVNNMLAVNARNGTGLNVLVYSAHDLNLFGLASVLGVGHQTPEVADYADAMTVELHQNGNCEPLVKVIYFSNADVVTEEIVPNVPNCGTTCTLSTFVNSVSSNLVPDLDAICRL